MEKTHEYQRGPMISFRVPSKHHRDLIYLAAKQDRLSVSAYLRRAIAEHLEGKK